jgi:two-component system, OmpR family, response regulator
LAERRALLVDDDVSNRTALAWLLEDAGFVVDVAGSLAEAKQRLHDGLVLVILDVHLADGLGTSLVGDVRARASRAKIAMLSGTGADEDSGADLALTKGAEPEATIAELVRLVG